MVKIAEEEPEKPAKIAEDDGHKQPAVTVAVRGATDHLLVTVGAVTYDITRAGTEIPADHVEQVRRAAASSRVPLATR